MTGIYDSVSKKLPWCLARSEDFHLQSTEGNIWHRKSGYIHALDGFVQTLVFLFRSQFSHSWPACKGPYRPCTLHHPQSAFCWQRKWWNRPSSFQRSGYKQGDKQHVATGAVLITMAAMVSRWSSWLLKGVFQHIHVLSMYIYTLYIYYVERRGLGLGLGWKNKEMNTWETIWASQAFACGPSLFKHSTSAKRKHRSTEVSFSYCCLNCRIVNVVPHFAHFAPVHFQTP